MNFKSYHIIAYSVRYSRGDSSERDDYQIRLTLSKTKLEQNLSSKWGMMNRKNIQYPGMGSEINSTEITYVQIIKAYMLRLEFLFYMRTMLECSSN